MKLGQSFCVSSGPCLYGSGTSPSSVSAEAFFSDELDPGPRAHPTVIRLTARRPNADLDGLSSPASTRTCCSRLSIEPDSWAVISIERARSSANPFAFSVPFLVPVLSCALPSLAPNIPTPSLLLLSLIIPITISQTAKLVGRSLHDASDAELDLARFSTTGAPRAACLAAKDRRGQGRVRERDREVGLSRDEEGRESRAEV